MKIKQDFVTNSSSTCYIVAIPKDLEIKTEDKELDKIMSMFLENLKTEGVIEFGMCAEYNFELPEDEEGNFIDSFYDAVHEKILNDQFVVLQEDFGADYPDKIINLNTDRFRESINKCIGVINEGKE